MSKQTKAKEWAMIAVQYHQQAERKGCEIPFPDICYCRGRIHEHGKPLTRTVEAMNVATPCPVISKKTRAARVRAMGQALGLDESRKMSREINADLQAASDAVKEYYDAC